MRRLVELLTIYTAILFLVISSAAFSGCAAKTNAKTKTDGKAVSESISESAGKSVSEPVIESDASGRYAAAHENVALKLKEHAG